jgi:hypothetical protein
MSDDIGLSEKRMYGETRPESVIYVASGLGVTRVETAGGQIGRFSLLKRCTARDIAGSNGEIAVATDEDVLLSTGDGFAHSDFGPATAVGYDDDGLIVAGNGRIARYDGGWDTVGSVPDVTAINGGLIGADNGVYELPDCRRIGLAEVTDVASGYAATTSGLYRHEKDNWVECRRGHHTAVAHNGSRVHAAGDAFVELNDGQWTQCGIPVGERVVDVTRGDGTYAVTDGGTVLVETTDERTADGRGGWRHRSLGVPDVVGIAVP